MAIGSLAISACSPDRAPSTHLPEATSSQRPLVRALGGEPATLDPRLAEDNAALALLQELYEGLTAEAADGRIVPGAAESWSVSPDGRTWTFRLRANLRWSDGTPLSAAQFVAGLDAARAEESQAPYSELLAEITSARATDARTVVLELARAVPYLPAVLALPVAAPLHHAANPAESPVGNGPYRLLLRRPGEKIELERNPEYHAASSVAIDRVTYLTLEDLNTELNLTARTRSTSPARCPTRRSTGCSRTCPVNCTSHPSSARTATRSTWHASRPGCARGAGDGDRPATDRHSSHGRRRDRRLRLGSAGDSRATHPRVSTGATSRQASAHSGRASSG